MSNGNSNKCRVCLSDGAKYSIFENIEGKDSVYSKLYQCLQEKVEDKEGFPRSICESCNNILNTTINFITKYRTSDKLLQSNVIVVKKEVICDSDDDVLKEEFEVELCKDEPTSDWIESFDESICIQLPAVEKQETSLTVIKAKLKGLKEINFKRKATQKSNKKTSKVASSILEAEFAWNGESLRSSLMKEPRDEKPKEPQKKTKLELPKPPKQNETCLCDICGEIFNHKDKLSKHRKLQHFNVTCECLKCHKVLKTNYYLKKHMIRIHGKKKYICESCGKAYAVKTELASHIRRIHQTSASHPKKNYKKFKCVVCDKVFTNSKSLVIHERSAHTGHRPAECMVCGVGFYHEDYLKEHLRLHTGETPYNCPICGRGYAQLGNMKSHISHNHRLQDLSPEVAKNLKPSWFKYLKKP